MTSSDRFVAPARVAAGARAAQRGLSNLNSGSPFPPEQRKSFLIGVVTGALLPGLGLLYAAPFVATAILTGVVGITFVLLTLLSKIPLLGLIFWWLKFIAFAVVSLASALLGALYVANYNRNGRRTFLSETRGASRDENRLPI